MGESPINPDKNCILRLSFEDAFSTYNNAYGAIVTIPSGIRFDDGGIIGTSLTGTNKVTVKLKNSVKGPFSIRFRLKQYNNPANIGWLADAGSAFQFLFQGTRFRGAVNPWVGTIPFIDPVINGKEYDILFTYNGVSTYNLYIDGVPVLSPQVGTSNISRSTINLLNRSNEAFDGVLRLFEVYNKQFSAIEASLIANNSLYRRPAPIGTTLLDYSSLQGIHEDVNGKTGLIPTNAPIEKYKNVMALKLKGATNNGVEVTGIDLAGKEFLVSFWVDNSPDLLSPQFRIFNAGTDNFVIYFTSKTNLYVYKTDGAGVYIYITLVPGLNHVAFRLGPSLSIRAWLNGANITYVNTFTGFTIASGLRYGIGNRGSGGVNGRGIIPKLMVIETTASTAILDKFVAQQYNSEKYLFGL